MGGFFNGVVATGRRSLTLPLGCALVLATAALPTPANAASITVTGPEQVVYDKSTQGCEFADQPDIPTRAIRDSTGQVQLTIAGPTTRRLIGPDFDHLTHPCDPIRTSSLSPYPWEFNDRGWMSSLYTPDGDHVYALVHAEFHGQRHPGLCPSNVFIDCRYNGVTFSSSSDRGATYTDPPFPDNVVATIPYRYVPEAGRYGVFSPSNIIERNGFFYAMILISQSYGQQRAGACLMRTRTPDDPKSWRAWDGAAFTVRFVNPYLEPSAAPLTHACMPVAGNEIGQIERSLVYNTYLNKFVVIGTESKYEPSLGRVVRGFYYSFSDDMINWSDKQLLYETSPTVCPSRPPRVYPSLIDHNAAGRNFDTVGRFAYLYYLLGNFDSNCQKVFDNDLARAPIEFSP